MGRPKHGDTCIGCTDPARLPDLLAAERAKLDALAAQARQHREAGAAAKEAELQELLESGTSPTYYGLQRQAVTELGTANSMFSGISMMRAHLDRVEAAHRPPAPVTDTSGPFAPNDGRDGHGQQCHGVNR